MTPETLYTHYQIDLENISEEWDTTICDSLKGVMQILEYLDIHLDDATETANGEKRRVIITGIGMTRQQYKDWKAEYLKD